MPLGNPDRPIFCIRQNIRGESDAIRFLISKNGGYLIVKSEVDRDEIIVDWTRTFLISPDGQENTLSVRKNGNQYRFCINHVEVERVEIDGFSGGGIGLEASLKVDVGFDDFKIKRDPSTFGAYSLKDQNAFVFMAMTTSYLWYEKVPEVDYLSFESPENLLSYLKYEELDKWSYIVSKDEYDAYVEDGSYMGMGFSFKFNTMNECRVKYVYTDSPAESAGLMRGDKILEIDGMRVEEIETNDLWDTIIGNKELNTPVRVKIDSEGL